MRKVIIFIVCLVAGLASGKYYVPNFRANWFKAVQHCKYEGARLAIVDSAQKQENLVKMVNETEMFSIFKTEFWIGASDLAEEGHFTWHATGVGLRHTCWKHGQPNNAENGEDCVEIRYSTIEKWDWQWNDVDCMKMRYFACEN